MARNATMRLADLIIGALSDHGVSHIFGVGGANIEDLYDAAAARSDVTALLAKHEFSAAAMADGYSRATGRLGVVMATSGGGALNLVAGLGESLASRVPVLALVGQTPTTFDGRGSFQDTSGLAGSLDAVRLFGAVSVFCRRVATADEVIRALPSAIRAAQRGGPAVLLLPKDIQQSSLPFDAFADTADELDVGSAPGSVEELAVALSGRSSAVTIIAGQQVARDDARAELEQLGALLDARIATTPDAKDVVAGTPSNASRILGVTGVMGNPRVASAIRDGDTCLLIGTRMTMTARSGLDDALAAVTTMSIGSARPYLHVPHVHSDDLKKSLSQLASAVEASADHGDTAAPWHGELEPPSHVGAGIRYRDAMAALDRLIPDDADIVVDAGNTGAAAVHHLPARPDGRFLVALGMGGMGYSFGAGVGVAVGRGRRTVVIAGDGAFLMHGMEIHTAIQYSLPITYVIFNNNAHAMCVTREQLFYQADYSFNRFRPSHLGAGLSAMFPGFPAVDVTTNDELDDALRTALHVRGPALVSVECSADEIPPFAPFLAVPQHSRPKKENTTDATASA